MTLWKDSQNRFFISNRDHYDCHIKGTYICNGKMYVEDEY